MLVYIGGVSRVMGCLNFSNFLLLFNYTGRAYVQTIKVNNHRLCYATVSAHVSIDES